MKLALAGALVLAFASPALAVDCDTFDAVLADAHAHGVNPYIIPADKLDKVVKDIEAITGDDYGKVTRGFMAFEPGVTTVGLEANGCLYAPIRIAPPGPDAAA